MNFRLLFPRELARETSQLHQPLASPRRIIAARGAIRQAKGACHMTAQVSWGTIPLLLDNEAFQKGFLAARQWYFQDIYGEDGRLPEEPQHAVQLSSETVLRLIAQPDAQRRYRLDEIGLDLLPEYLGYLVGYLGGPLDPDEAEHYRKEQARQEQLRSSVAV